jgi:ABC-type polar amino acid transport system ATPase subunit
VPGHEAALLAADGLRLSLGGRRVLDGVSFELREGEVLCLMGPSGCGKTSLLRSLNLLEVVESGTILYRGSPVAFSRSRFGALKWHAPFTLQQYRTEVGMVFQGYNVWTHLTALENVAMPLRQIRGLAATTANDRAQDYLARVGLQHRTTSYSSRLSGGEMQRLAIARTLAMEPAVLLLDEPTSSLDPELVQEVLDVIQNLARDGTTMIIVTHEIGLAKAVGSTLAFMDKGAIVERGSPGAVIGAPRSPRLRAFLEKIIPA